MIKDQLREDMKAAMKAGDKVKLEVIRFLLAEIRNVEIDHGDQTDDQVQNLIRKEIKQMQESNVQYRTAGRNDLILDNEAKIAILEEYIPSMLTEAELTAVVAACIKANPDQAMGPLIGEVRAKTAGRADGSAIAAEVKKQLGA